MTGVPALSRATVDRDAKTRDDPTALELAWATARVLVVQEGAALVAEDDRPRLVLLEAADAPEGERFYLGRDADGPVFAVTGELPRRLGARRLGLRDVGALLDDRDAGLLVHAVGLANWHATHPHCARCGAATEVVRGGTVRRCPVDASMHFPRTDPAMIVLVHDGGDRCVLGRQSVWPAGRFSTLAGFVEPGESAEQAVVREVAEETGLAVDEVAYVSSQPWPFPSSLMLGFRARCAGDAVPVPVDGELEQVRWFSRDELRGAGPWGAPGGGVQLPGSVSIARLLIDGWLAED
ncbi:MAG: NAD(+) diphosphatase [Frankiaceae bacterium]|nr:NAD(+) diphosphatase [Frankiaceae bacterium]